ncbi:MAG TPA: hypothetical protein VFS41_00995, partial [Edaphobacter sp.]|nr:hypothetical protein [Edaphobacter sp.]
MAGKNIRAGVSTSDCHRSLFHSGVPFVSSLSAVPSVTTTCLKVTPRKKNLGTAQVWRKTVSRADGLVNGTQQRRSQARRKLFGQVVVQLVVMSFDALRVDEDDGVIGDECDRRGEVP